MFSTNVLGMNMVHHWASSESDQIKTSHGNGTFQGASRQAKYWQFQGGGSSKLTLPPPVAGGCCFSQLSWLLGCWLMLPRSWGQGEGNSVKLKHHRAFLSYWNLVFFFFLNKHFLDYCKSAVNFQISKQLILTLWGVFSLFGGGDFLGSLLCRSGSCLPSSKVPWPQKAQ